MKSGSALPERLARLLPGVWLGGLLTIAAVAAPSLFALLERPLAGRVASRIFHLEALASLALSVLLMLLEQWRMRRAAETGAGRGVSVEMLCVLGALACTVAGHYGLQPLMEAARAGQPGNWSFGALHGASTTLYGLKTVLVAVLAWRAARPG